MTRPATSHWGPSGGQLDWLPYEPLTIDEQIEVGRAMHAAKARGDDAEFVEHRNRLVLACLPFMVGGVLRITGTRNIADAAATTARMVVRKIVQYDPERGLSLTTFMGDSIRGIARQVRLDACLVRPTVPAYTLAMRAGKHGPPEASTKSIHREMAEKAAAALSARALSVVETDKITHADQSKVDDADMIDRLYDSGRRMNPRTWEFIERYYGLNGRRRETCREIAADHKMSKQAVGKAIEKGRRQLKVLIGREYMEESA